MWHRTKHFRSHEYVMTIMIEPIQSEDIPTVVFTKMFIQHLFRKIMSLVELVREDIDQIIFYTLLMHVYRYTTIYIHTIAYMLLIIK